MDKENNIEVENMETVKTEVEFKKIKSKKSGTFDKLSRLYRGKNKVYWYLLTILFITAPLVLVSAYNLGQPKIKRFEANQKSEYKGIEMSITMSNESYTLDYSVDNATIKLDSNKYMEIDSSVLETVDKTDLNLLEDTYEDEGTEYKINKELKLKTFDCYDGFMYAVYVNNDESGGRELLISKDMPAGLSVEGMQSVDGDVYELNSDVIVSSFKKSYDDSTIYYSDQIIGGKLGTKTLVSRMQNIENNMKFNERDEAVPEEVIVNIDELGTLKASTISGLNTAPGIYFSNSDGVLRLYNYEEDMPYIFVSHLNNQLFFCNASDLLETNYDKLFVTKGFDDPESTGYRTFAITTKNNVYAFRVNSEVDESALIDLLAAFGYDKNNLSIKAVQQMVSEDIVNEALENVENAETTESIENVESTENLDNKEE